MTSANPATAPSRDGISTFRFAGPPSTPAGRIRLLLGLIVAFALMIGFLSAGDYFLNDPDTMWHVAVGGDIWRARSFPHVDTYSHSFAGHPWIAKEWLSQILLFAAFELAGWNGVALFTIVILLVVFLQLYFGLAENLAPTIAAGAAMALVAISSPVFVARPHVLALPVVILFVQSVWRSAEDGRAPRFWLLAVMALWANLHGSFTFGCVAAGLSFLHYLYLHRRFRDPVTYRWLAFLVLCPAASALNPYGLEAIWSTLFIVKSEALPYIDEWRSFNARDDAIQAVVLLALLMAALARGLRLKITTAIFTAVLVYMYLTHIRFVYLLFLLAPLVMAREIAAQFPSISFRFWNAQLQDSAFEQRLARYAPYASLAIVAALALSAALVSANSQWSPRRAYPAAAINAARAAGLNCHVLNHYNFGGALIFEGVPTFVDGRADRIFQDGLMPDIGKMRNGDNDVLDRQLNKYDICWTIFPPKDRRVALMDDKSGWSRVYADDFAVVHARASAKR